MLERIIKILKKDPNYKFEQTYPFKDLLIIGSERFFQLIRGLIHKLFIKTTKGLIFVGSGVKIKHANHLVCGRNLILSDNVYLNALSKSGILIGDDVSIGRNCSLICTGVIANIGHGIRIGNGVGINADVFLGGQGGIVVGDNTIIGPGVKIFSENHNYSDSTKLIKKQGESRAGVSIGENCWIGSGATILAGVVIGNGNVVAAGAVITKSFGDNNILAGIPAKILKSRCNS